MTQIRHQGIHSLGGKMSYDQISSNLGAVGYKSKHIEISQASQHHFFPKQMLDR